MKHLAVNSYGQHDVVFRCLILRVRPCRDGTLPSACTDCLWRLVGGLAQLGERLPCKQEVSGSIPLISTMILQGSPIPYSLFTFS